MAALYTCVALLCVAVIGSAFVTTNTSVDAIPSGIFRTTDTCKGYRLPSANVSTCDLKADRGIDCDSSNKNLTKIPKEYPAGLFHASFSYNSITSLGNDSFQNCNNLQLLYLSHNRITFMDGDTFKTVPHLNQLILSFNNIVFANPTNWLHNNPQLYKLYIDHNLLWKNGSDIFRNKTKLQKVHMDTTAKMEFDSNFNELKGLQLLHLYGNIRHIQNRTFEQFAKLSKFSQLSFGGCNLEKIDKMGFSHLKFLRKLYLANNNQLGFEGIHSMAHGLQYTRLSELHIQNISKSNSNHINSSFFASFQNVSGLSNVDIGSNNIALIDFRNICEYIPNLRILILRNNVINKVENFQHLTNCKGLYVVNAAFQMGTRKAMTRLPFNTLTLPPSIETLNLNDVFQVKRIGSLTLHGALKLQNINLMHNGLEHIDGPIRYSEPCNLGIDINLGSNSISTISHRAFHESLARCIHILKLPRNNLWKEIRDSNYSLFEKFGNLKSLDLSYNKITHMRYDFLKNLQSLVNLILYGNMLTSLVNIDFLDHLTLLDIGKNNVAFLSSKDMFSLISVRKRSNATFEVVLNANPLICTCESLQFLKWLLGASDYVKGWRDNDCKNFEIGRFNETLSKFIVPHLNVSCNLRFRVIVGGSSLGVFLIIVVISICIYRKRWHVRYWCIKSARTRKRYQYLQDTESFVYDAFVMYNSDDLRWITDELLEHLEKQSENDESNEGVTLCLHHRDFIGGNYITENIVDAIDNSRKCLLVLSRNFCKSEWTHFEMQMARARAINERRNIIIVIRLEDVPFREMSNTLLDILKTYTYIEYPAEEQAKQAFWGKVKDAIKEPC